MKRILLSAVVLSAVGLNAQSKAPAVKTEKAVGIETSQPRATLDVNGDARLQKAELMTTSTPTEEIFPDCPCVLVIDEYGIIKRIPKDQFVLAGGSGTTSGSTGGGQGSGSGHGNGSGGSQGGTTGNPGGGQGSGSGGNQGGSPGNGGNQGGDNQSTGGANLGAGVSATIKDVDEYVVSFIYDGHQLQGKIDNNEHKVVVNIPYTNGNSAQYNTATSTTTTNAASAQDGQSSPITMTIKEGTLSSGNGNITAEITTPALYNVKKLAPGEEETIAEFKYTVNNQTKTVVLKAVGGVPDKNFADADHKFIYIPVTVEGTHNVNGTPYSKVWLNQNLGADYANLKGGHFNPKKVGGDNKSDYKAYGSLFQFGRPADGHELMVWSATNTSTYSSSASHRKNEETIAYKSDSELFYSKDNDPCPKGFHTPSETEWTDLFEAFTGERIFNSSSAIWNDNSKLGLPAAGSMRWLGDGWVYAPGTNGEYWASTLEPRGRSMTMHFSETYANPRSYQNNKGYGISVRCIKD